MVKILLSISEAKNMSKKEAILYLQNVLDNWSEFCNGHKPFALALEVLLPEVQR